MIETTGSGPENCGSWVNREDRPVTEVEPQVREGEWSAAISLRLARSLLRGGIQNRHGGGASNRRSQHVTGIPRVLADSLAVVLSTPAALTLRLTANALLGSVNRGLENLLAVAATPARNHARFLCSPQDSFVEPSSRTKPTRSEYRNFCRVLTASLPLGPEAGSLAPS